MKSKRWSRLVLFFLAIPSLVLACNGGGEVPSPEVKPPEGTPIKEERLPAPTTGEQTLLASMLPSVQEMSTLLPRRQWTAGETGEATISAAQPTTGLIASWGRVFSAPTRDAQPPEEVQIFLTLYDAEDNADAAMQALQQLDIEVEPFDLEEAGDESQGLVTRPPDGPPYTVALLRVDRVVAGIILPLSDEHGERREEVRQLAQMVAGNIQLALER